MIIDNHVHVGWYSDGYHSPLEIWRSLKQAGVNSAAVSSTSTCAELYHNIQTEFNQLIAIAGRGNIKPLLWISPTMIIKEWPIKKLLKSKIDWRGVKLHYVSHPHFSNNKKLVNSALSIARELGNVPILLHTGGWPNCYASVFETLICENQDLKFVLAHGRPIEETIEILERHSNVWTDTAFMPVEDIKKLKKANLSDRVLFGSDAQINQIYSPSQTTPEYLKERIEAIQRIDPSILERTIY